MKNFTYKPDDSRLFIELKFEWSKKIIYTAKIFRQTYNEVQDFELK